MRLLYITFISFSFIIAIKAEEKFVIGKHGVGAGLFSCFFGVLNNLAWCEKNNKVPVVHWGEYPLYYEPQGYNGSKEVWQYYFEPVSHAVFEPGDSIRNSYHAPDRKDSVPNFARHSCQRLSDKKFREKVNGIIKRNIKIKQNIMKKVEDFYQEKMLGKVTIGIHIRGTDKSREVKQVSPSVIFGEANKIAQREPEAQFLIATDEANIIEEAKRYLNGNVIYYDSYRSTDGRPIHRRKDKQSDKAKHGEEVIVEVQLLSRCNFFLHTCSNVSAAVLFFNPKIENIIFDDLDT